MQFYLAWSESLTVKVIFEQRPEGDLSVEPSGHLCGEYFRAEKTASCQDPEAGRCLVH